MDKTSWTSVLAKCSLLHLTITFLQDQKIICVYNSKTKKYPARTTNEKKINNNNLRFLTSLHIINIIYTWTLVFGLECAEVHGATHCVTIATMWLTVELKVAWLTSPGTLAHTPKLRIFRHRYVFPAFSRRRVTGRKNTRNRY